MRPISNPIPYEPDYTFFFMLIYLVYIAFSLGFWVLIIMELKEIRKAIEEKAR